MSDAADARLTLFHGSSGPGIDLRFGGANGPSICFLLEDRIARLLPKLTCADRAFATAHVRTLLMAMVRDEAERIRSVIEEAIESMVQPSRVQPIEAVDAIELLVPVLTDADVIYLLATPPCPHSMSSHADHPAILSLLADGSAAVQEAILDALFGNTSEPQPLPTALSSQATQSLREIAAGYALEPPNQNEELPAPLQAEMTAQIHPGGPEPDGDEGVLASVRALKASNALTESTLLDAARRGEERRVAAILAIASGVPLDAIDRAAWLRSGKALVALAWKSGFTMRSAVAAQSALGQLSPPDRLGPDKDGKFPLATSEMEWQIELMRSLRDEDPRRAT